MVKGFNQILGVDYTDTFSTTCKPETYRTIFIIALFHGWKLRQYDVTNVFVYTNIDTDIYVELPEGYNNIINTNISNNKIIKLNKVLYNLK